MFTVAHIEPFCLLTWMSSGHSELRPRKSIVGGLIGKFLTHSPFHHGVIVIHQSHACPRVASRDGDQDVPLSCGFPWLFGSDFHQEELRKVSWALSLFSLFKYLFIYFWPHRVFAAVHGLSLVVVSEGYSLIAVRGLLTAGASLVGEHRL